MKKYLLLLLVVSPAYADYSMQNVNSYSRNTSSVTQSGIFQVEPGTNTYKAAITNFPVSQAVTGTFYQVSQPVSGNVAIIQNTVLGATVTYNGTQVVSILQPTVLGATVTFNGTQNVNAGQTGTYTVTQGSASTSGWKIDLSTGVQVNGTVTSNQGTAGASGWKVDFSTGVQVLQGAAGASGWKVDFSTGVLITPATLTKGSQGATGLTVQELKDAGRTAVAYSVTASTVGATTVESALTFTKSAGTGGTSNGQSFVITSGKRFRIMAITVATLGNATATTQTTTFNLRINTAGSCATGSTPVLMKFRTTTPATALAWDRYYLTIPDGYEIAGDGTLTLCASVNSTFVTNAPTADMTIVGYEY